MNLLDNCKFTTLYRGDTATSSTDHPCTSKHVDMAGFEGCLLVTSVVDVTGGVSTGSFNLVGYHSASTASTSFTSLGTTATAGITALLSTSKFGLVCAVDVHKPLKRYLSATVTRAGNGKSLLGPVIAIQYNNHVGPITQSTTYVLDSTLSVSPTT